MQITSLSLPPPLLLLPGARIIIIMPQNASLNQGGHCWVDAGARKWAPNTMRLPNDDDANYNANADDDDIDQPERTNSEQARARERVLIITTFIRSAPCDRGLFCTFNSL